MEKEQASYRFKWDNYDLQRYGRNIRARASKLRMDAALLIARAEQIETEWNELEDSLVLTTTAGEG